MTDIRQRHKLFWDALKPLKYISIVLVGVFAIFFNPIILLAGICSLLLVAYPHWIRWGYFEWPIKPFVKWSGILSGVNCVAIVLVVARFPELFPDSSAILYYTVTLLVMCFITGAAAIFLYDQIDYIK